MERLLEKQKELTERVRANEKVVAAIGLFGSVALAFIGAGYFAPKAEAHMGHDFPTWPTAGEIPEEEMKRVFNLGIGYCVIVPANTSELTMDIIRDEGINCWEIGEVYE